MTLRTISRPNGRNRSAGDPAVPTKATPAIITTITLVSDDRIQLTFDTNVIASKTPGYIGGAGGIATVNSITQISATQVELAFSEDVAGTDMVIGVDDAGIRTVTGGFVPAGNYAIPAV